MVNENPDVLLEAAVELAAELHQFGLPLILGGGLSLYIRTGILEKQRSARFIHQASQRSTKDIDVFLTTDIIVSETESRIVRDTLNKLGYRVKTNYFQFERKLHQGKSVLIDLLAPPVEEDESREIRVRTAASKLHARRNRDAMGIHIGLVQVPEPLLQGSCGNIFLVSSFNYIILKLNALKDRVEDEVSDYGRHHAYDIFATVIDMDENDWRNAIGHLQNEREKPYIQSAIELAKTFFGHEEAMGVIRLKENKAYQNDAAIFNSYLNEVRNDLLELFS